MSDDGSMSGQDFVMFLIEHKGFLPVVCCGFCTGAVNPATVDVGGKLEQTCPTCGGGFEVIEEDGKKALQPAGGTEA